MNGRLEQHRVQHGKRRHREPPHHFEHLISIGPAVQPVLVLHDRDIAGAELIDRGHN